MEEGDSKAVVYVKQVARRLYCLFKGHWFYYDGGLLTERTGRYCCKRCGKTVYGDMID